MTTKRIRWMAGMLTAALLMTAAPALAQSAVVNNGSDPKSRLNMRAQPSRDAAVLGKFYSGTQVEVLADAGGGWSQVRVGGVKGYMMTQYLSAGGAGVTDGTYDRQVVSPYGTQSVVLRDRPSDSYDAVAMLTVGETVRVLGTSGDYCYVRAQDASVGCLSGDELE